MTQSISSAEFRDALARWASGVTVVTADGASGRVGLTATAFTSVSLSPPLVLVCVSRSASAHDALARAPVFVVSVLEERQGWIAAQFSRRGVDRFDGVPFETSPSGVPAIAGAIVRLECRHHTRHDAGDHSLLVGEVTGARIAPGRPLLHYGRRFAVLERDEASSFGAHGGVAAGGA